MTKYIFFLLFPSIFFSCNNNRVQFIPKTLPLARQRITSLYLDTYRFPDSIIVDFVQSSLCTPKEGKIQEVIEGEIYESNYSITINSNSSNRIIWILGDWSGSLRYLSHSIDSILLDISKTLFENEEIYYIKFAQDIIHSFHANYKEIKINNLAKTPSPNGSNIQNGMDYIISNLYPDKDNVIFLFSDGDFPPSFPLDSLLNILNEKGIKVFSVGIGNPKRDFLSTIGNRSGGFYIDWEENVTHEMIAPLIYYGSLKSYRITYSPLYKKLDGTKHIINFKSECGDFRLEYSAPLVTPQKIPVSFFNIPFIDLASTKPSIAGQFMLDSLINTISEISDEWPLLIKIDGYTCSLGTDEINSELSRQRARYIELQLKERFKNRKNLEYVVDWYGKENPLYEGEDRWNLELNRRVEVRLLLKN